MENKKAIEVLKTAYDCRKSNYWPYDCDKCLHTEKCYTAREHWEAIELAIASLERQRTMPEIVCLCGSTKFYKTFEEQNFKLTLAGNIVLSIGCNTKSDDGLNLSADDKVKLDELHKRKIDLCDSVLVLNVGGYIGESTRSEIEYAKKIGKPVSYLEELEG